MFDSALGKIIGQFRGFMLHAFTKQFMHGVAMNDMRVYGAWATSSFIAAGVYAAQTSINAQGRSDSKEYLEERLAPKAIVASGFQRTAASSIFPALIDTTANLTNLPAPFAHGRTSGLATGGITGNPSVDLGNDIGMTIQAITGLAKPGHKFSQQEARAIAGLLPFMNAFGIRNLVNLSVQDLPKSSERQN